MCLSVSYLFLPHRSIPVLFLAVIMRLNSLGNRTVVVTQVAKEIFHYESKWMRMYFSHTRGDMLRSVLSATPCLPVRI
jgi:hypothetical protein